MKIFISIVAFFLAAISFAQKPTFSGGVEVGAFVSTDSELPFWVYSNTARKIGAKTDFSSSVFSKIEYELSENAKFQVGVAAYYRNDVTTEFQRKELYLQFNNRWLEAVLGAKQAEEQVLGLSASNKNFLWSGNARPIPGILLTSPDSLKIWNNFHMEYSLGHFVLNDDRYVDNTWIHFKKIGIHYSFHEKNTFSASIQHFAQWAGNSPDFGDLPDDFNAFYEVFLAKRSSENLYNERGNALGNHLGTYFFEYRYKNGFQINVYHEHPFEDGSGTRFANLPDGIWGINYRPENRSIFSLLLYEFVTTKNQSKNTTAGRDNYFNNSIYRSGWSYEQQIIGIPFVLYDPTIQTSLEDPTPIVNNVFEAHHLGVAGSRGNFQWKAKMSYVRNFGRDVNRVRADDQFLSYAEVSYRKEKLGELSLIAGFDYRNAGNTTSAIGIGYNFLF